MVVRHTH